MTHLDRVHCAWVPGTFDQVRISAAQRTAQLPVRHVARLFGREAVEALYLKGRYVRSLADSDPLTGEHLTRLIGDHST